MDVDHFRLFSDRFRSSPDRLGSFSNCFGSCSNRFGSFPDRFGQLQSSKKKQSSIGQDWGPSLTDRCADPTRPAPALANCFFFKIRNENELKTNTFFLQKYIIWHWWPCERTYDTFWRSTFLLSLIWYMFLFDLIHFQPLCFPQFLCFFRPLSFPLW